MLSRRPGPIGSGGDLLHSVRPLGSGEVSTRGPGPLGSREQPAKPQDTWRAPPKKKRKAATPEVIVFVTKGDDKKMNVFKIGAQVFAELGSNDANRIIRVSTVQQATKALEGLPPASLKKVVFLGHGVSPQGTPGRLDPENEALETRLLREGPGFIFEGYRTGDGPNDFSWDQTDNVLWASTAHQPSVAFMAMLAGKLAPDAHVYLQSCYSGKDGSAGSLVKRFGDALSPDNHKRVTVAGYKSDLKYEDIIDPETKRLLGYGSRIEGQEVTPFKPIPKYRTNPPGIPPQDAIVTRGSETGSKP